MANYRKLPVVIEAMRFTDEDKEKVLRWVSGWELHNSWASFDNDGNPCIKIETLEGVMSAGIGDWIIKGVTGEYYPCKNDIFCATYELVE